MKITGSTQEKGLCLPSRLLGLSMPRGIGSSLPLLLALAGGAPSSPVAGLRGAPLYRVTGHLLPWPCGAWRISPTPCLPSLVPPGWEEMEGSELGAKHQIRVGVSGHTGEEQCPVGIK